MGSSRIPRPLLLDCDPGLDDAIAILLALSAPDQLQLLGITTVAGNVPLALTQKNARKICELVGRPDIPVYAGCPRPLLRPLVTAEEVHGPTGLAGPDLPEPCMPLQPEHGVDFLIRTLMQAEQPITLAVTGPMTNIAVALIKEPRICGHIEELVFMGGSASEGNITPTAEFNVFVDPHAAHVVLTSGLKLTMVGLHLSHQVVTTPERLQRIQALNTPVSDAVVKLISHHSRGDAEQFDLSGGPLHDPCVIAYLLQPELFVGQEFSVAVELCGSETLGQTVVDRRRMRSDLANVNVLMTADVEGFYQLLITSLEKY
ncbi:MAG: nucleoside hydrolase [Synechococcaceae cyanobacterium SM2_3_1]|nr:nucleoside hydrolase [Synechococcaceae cyanobacterium SM2_3_1]